MDRNSSDASLRHDDTLLEEKDVLGAFPSLGVCDHDHTRGSPYWLTGIATGILVLFLVANIYGADRTVRYYNERQRELYWGGTQQRLLGLEL